MRFTLTAGQAGDAPQALVLLDGLATSAVLGDRGYDSDAILAWVAERGAVPVIPPHPCRAGGRATDWWLYKERAKVEVMIGMIKQFRRVFARFDKLARRYLAFVHFAAACIQLR